jgi:hypothetical protein
MISSSFASRCPFNLPAASAVIQVRVPLNTARMPCPHMLLAIMSSQMSHSYSIGRAEYGGIRYSG